MVRVLLAMTLLAGCRSPAHVRDPGESSLATDDPDRQICAPAQVTGTMITRTVCRSASEADAEKAAAQAWMTQPVNRTSFPNTTPGPGGHR
jgi:hypothetical protein